MLINTHLVGELIWGGDGEGEEKEILWYSEGGGIIASALALARSSVSVSADNQSSVQLYECNVNKLVECSWMNVNWPNNEFRRHYEFHINLWNGLEWIHVNWINHEWSQTANWLYNYL